MELIKGAPVSAKIKEEVGAMLEKINGPAPKLAIVRVGEIQMICPTKEEL